MQLGSLVCVLPTETHALLAHISGWAVACGRVLELATLQGHCKGAFLAKIAFRNRLSWGGGGGCGITQQFCCSKGGAQAICPCSGLLGMLLCLVRQTAASGFCSMSLPALPAHGMWLLSLQCFYLNILHFCSAFSFNVVWWAMGPFQHGGKHHWNNSQLVEPACLYVTHNFPPALRGITCGEEQSGCLVVSTEIMQEYRAKKQSETLH